MITVATTSNNETTTVTPISIISLRQRQSSGNYGDKRPFFSRRLRWARRELAAGFQATSFMT
jgi:hypothetical protein